MEKSLELAIWDHDRIGKTQDFLGGARFVFLSTNSLDLSKSFPWICESQPFQPDQVQPWFRPPPRSLGCLDGRDGEGGLAVAADVGPAQLLGGGLHRTQAELGHSASTVTWIPTCANQCDL